MIRALTVGNATAGPVGRCVALTLHGGEAHFLIIVVNAVVIFAFSHRFRVGVALDLRGQGRSSGLPLTIFRCVLFHQLRSAQEREVRLTRGRATEKVSEQTYSQIT